jgi:hypothetical protein
MPAGLIFHVIKIGRFTRASKATAMENGLYSNTEQITENANTLQKRNWKGSSILTVTQLGVLVIPRIIMPARYARLRLCPTDYTRFNVRSLLQLNVQSCPSVALYECSVFE